MGDGDGIEPVRRGEVGRMTRGVGKLTAKASNLPSRGARSMLKNLGSKLCSTNLFPDWCGKDERCKWPVEAWDLNVSYAIVNQEMLPRLGT